MAGGGDGVVRERRGGLGQIGLAAATAIPAILVKSGALDLAVEVETVLYGLAILGAAFLLTWGAEVAQIDISQGLAIAFLAFVAVLPEYAVDLVFAWKAGAQDGGASAGLCGTEPCRQLAIANMTGANRLLIGVGWAAVVIIWGFRTRARSLTLSPARRTELGFLFVATLWALSIPARGQLGVLDLAVLGGLFVTYLWRVAREDPEHPDLIGPPALIATFPAPRRRAATLLMFLYAAGAILVAAEPFAEGLVHTGEKLGISPFLLVQWLAPLASEAPEMIIAILFVLRSKPGSGMGALVSSKVNQWTLLVATLPLVYMISLGANVALRLDERQVEEVLLTAAQSLFAVAVIANLTITRAEAVGMMVLFLAQFGFESTTIRYGFSAVYLGLFALIVIASKDSRRGLWLGIKDVAQLPWRATRPTE